jgi:hypothetical protein
MIFGMNCPRTIGWILGTLVVWGSMPFGVDKGHYSLHFVNTVAAREEEWNAEDVLKHVSHAIPQQVPYEETHVTAILTTPIVSNGTLSFIPPSRLEKHVVSPREERYVIEGDSLLWEEMATGQTKKLFLPDYPLLQSFVEGFRAVFAGDLVSLRTWFAIEMVGAKNAWELKLIPIDDDIAEFVDALHFIGQGERITGIEIREVGGDYSHITISPEGT